MIAEELTAISKYIELGVVGLSLFIVLYYIFRIHLPKLQDTFSATMKEQQATFTSSLDKIAARDTENARIMTDAIKGLSGEITSVREVVAECRFKNRQIGA